MKIYVFNAKVSLFSPIRLAGEAEIKAILGLAELPEKLKPILRQQVVPKALLAPLEKQRKRLRDYLVRNATRHELLGWVVDPEMQTEMVERVEAIGRETLVEKQTLLAEYLEGCEQYRAEVLAELGDFDQAEAFVQVLANAQPALDYVEKQVQFQFLKPRAVDLDPQEAAMVREGLYGQTLHDLEQSAMNATQMKTTRARRKAADELVRKLKGLQYFDSRYGRIADQMADAVSTVKVGRDKDYTPAECVLVSGVFAILQDGEALAQRVEAGEAIFPVPVPVPVPVPDPMPDDEEIEDDGVSDESPVPDLFDDLDTLLPPVVTDEGVPPGGDKDDDENGELPMESPIPSSSPERQAGMFNW